MFTILCNDLKMKELKNILLNSHGKGNFVYLSLPVPGSVSGNTFGGKLHFSRMLFTAICSKLWVQTYVPIV